MADGENGLNAGETVAAGTPPENPHPGGKYYEIHVQGQLDNRWSEWFEGLEMRLLDNGEMVLSGYILDQAALMGVLNKLSRLNLALLAVNEVKKKD